MRMKNSIILFYFLALVYCMYVCIYNTIYFGVKRIVDSSFVDLKRAATHRQNTGVGIVLNTIFIV